jgi:predicted transposase/invertase (TIGR01784 family)
MLLLSERHKEQGAKKLPLVVPIVFYNGSKRYTAPRTLWELYADPKLAKQCMGNDYQLIDLSSMADDDIKHKQHLGVLEFFMKHIHNRDVLQVWKTFLRDFKEVIAQDQANDFLYLRYVLWYTDTKLTEGQQPALSELLKQNLAGGDGMMRTIADKYIEEGIEKGIVQGIAQGESQKARELIINMLKQNVDLKFIATVTGYTQEQIRTIQAEERLL